MKRFIAIHTLLIPALSLMILSCARDGKEKHVPINTRSETALELYNQGMAAAEDVYIGKAVGLLEDALMEDPDFFMAAYQLSLYSLFSGNRELSDRYAEVALHAETKLSDGEVIYRSILERFHNDPEADLTGLAGQLVELYPEDDQSYITLAFAKGLAGDDQGVVDAYARALEVTDNKASVYNMLGYAYLNLEKYGDAESAFDTYLELEPDLPNPYDSKGDYFMVVEEYEKAYDSYMKANRIDSTFSRLKALKAKELLDSLSIQ